MAISDYPGYMAGEGSSRGHAEPAQQELAVCIRLSALPWVSDSLLEDLTVCVEDALGERAAKLAPGASASANFADHAIELDFSVVTTPSEIHKLAGEVLQIALDALHQHADRTAVAFDSSATSAVLVAA
jgi:hypothetical protein